MQTSRPITPIFRLLLMALTMTITAASNFALGSQQVSEDIEARHESFPACPVRQQSSHHFDHTNRGGLVPDSNHPVIFSTAQSAELWPRFASRHAPVGTTVLYSVSPIWYFEADTKFCWSHIAKSTHVVSPRPWSCQANAQEPDSQCFEVDAELGVQEYGSFVQTHGPRSSYVFPGSSGQIALGPYNLRVPSVTSVDLSQVAKPASVQEYFTPRQSLDFHAIPIIFQHTDHRRQAGCHKGGAFGHHKHCRNIPSPRCCQSHDPQPQSRMHAHTRNHKACSEDHSLMQLPHPEEATSSEESVIPSDWYLDLQRRVNQLVQHCSPREDEVFFTVYTWYIDHSRETKNSHPLLATLGDYPPEWPEDIKFPWAHKIIRDEPLRIDMVQPPMAKLTRQEHIAHIILTQRWERLVSVLLVVEICYDHPIVFRSVLAIPNPCTRAKILELSEVAREYATHLRWVHPRIQNRFSPFRVFDGMAIHLQVNPQEVFPLNPLGDVQSFLQVDRPQLSEGHNRAIEHASAPQMPSSHERESLCSLKYVQPGVHPDHSLRHHVSPYIAFAKGAVGLPITLGYHPNRRALDLPPPKAEQQSFRFNVHAATFTPGVPPIQAQPENIQDLYTVLSQHAFAWQDGTLRHVIVETWYVNHQMLYPTCLQSRQVHLNEHFHLWEQQIKARWADQIDPAQEVELLLVTPPPPRLEEGIGAHVILIQSPRDQWVSNLVSVDDPIFNRINDGNLMRLVITTDEHFTIEHIAQSCGYPTTCASQAQPVRCFAWIQDHQLLPGLVWPGSSGTSIQFSVVRTPVPFSSAVPRHSEQTGLLQLQVKVHSSRINLPEPNTDAVSFMAQGRRQRRALSAEISVADNEQAARTLDQEEEDTSSSSESDTQQGVWQNAIIYSTRTGPVSRSVHLQSPRLRRYQIAHALLWPLQEVHSEFPLAVQPDDIEHQRSRVWLIRHQDDLPADVELALVLIDMVVHSYPPSWQTQLIRKPMYLPLEITARQILAALYLARYCSYAILPCLVYRNRVLWHQDHDESQELINGDYIKIHIPPPNSAQRELSTRCVMAATHHQYSFDIPIIFGPMPEYHINTVPNPSPYIDDNDPDTEEDSLIQVSRPGRPTQARPHKACCPRIRTTLGYHNVLCYERSPKSSRTQPSLTSQLAITQHLPLAPLVMSELAPFSVYTQQQRLGEAKVPGPTLQEPPDAKWAIGAINPTGLAGKAVLFTDLPEGIYAISETHLTARGRTRFKQELWHAKSPFTISAGYDAPYKKPNMRAVGGKHTGVAFLSTFPCRPIHSGWNVELHHSSRLHAATFQVNNTCIAGGVCYGYAHSPESKATQAMTDKLLQQLTTVVVDGFPGPAFVAGDFNQHPSILEETLRWESKGWKDIQTWAHELWGITPGPTCCQVSRKDFVYLSPSLQNLLVSCSNSFDKFPDHSTLFGILRLPSLPVPTARWPKPASIEYNDLPPGTIASYSCSFPVTGTTPTEKYAGICQAFEKHVSHVRTLHKQSALQKNQLGRGTTLERVFIKPQVVSIKHARSGEYQPQAQAWTLMHCRWVTQCRRLQHYVKHVKKASTHANAVEQRASVWRAIVAASGFPPNFATWWETQVKHDHQLYPWFPVYPPDLAVAEHIAHHFQESLRAFESRLIAKRVGEAKATRAHNVNRVYTDVRKPMPVPVQLLVAKSVAHITEVVDEGSVLVDCSDPIQHAAVLESRIGPLHIIHIEEQQVWFASPHQLVVGDALAEVHLKGLIHDIHQAFIDEWMRRWDRHRHLAADHWEEVIALTESLLHCPTMQLQPITLNRWKLAIKAKKPTSATGLDAMSRKDLLAMPDELHLHLLQLFQHAEHTGQWPQQLLQGAVHSLEKVPGAETVNEYRPITIMPVAYRVYTSIRSREILAHLQHHVPPTLLGNIPGRQATSLWWTMQHRIELALQAAEPLTGATSDVVKAFNHLPREVTFQVALRMGVHPHIVRAWAASATQLKRHFVVKNAPSAQVSSTTGFVEGCGLSVVAMVLINSLLHAYLQQKHPEVTFTTYVDNFELQSRQVAETTQALQSLSGFCQLLDIQLDQKKTYRWAVTAEGRREIRAADATIVTAARDLGAHMQFDSRQTNALVVSKFKALPSLWHLLARSHATYVQKLKVLRTVAWPRAMYSVSTVHIGSAHFIEARAGAMQAIGCTKAGANPQIHLSLTTHPSADPEFFALWNSVQQFRRNIPPELLELTLAATATTPSRQRKPGPGGVLVSRLESIC